MARPSSSALGANHGASTSGRSAMRRFAAVSAASLALSIGALTAVAPSVAFADGAPVDTASADQKLEAKTAFQQGVKLFDAEKYEEALALFKASHDVVASPNASFMMGRCNDKLGRFDEAYTALVPVEAESKGIDKYAQTVTEAQTLRGTLKGKVGLLTVLVTGPATNGTVAINGKPAIQATERALMPGHFEANVTVDGKVAKTETGDIAAGEQKTVTLNLLPTTGPTPVGPTPPTGPTGPTGPTLPPPPKENPVPYLPPLSKGSPSTGFYIAGGVLAALAVGGFATGIPFGVMAKNGKDDLDTSCPNFKCNLTQAQLDDDKNSISTHSTIATVGLVVGGVAAAGSITLFVVGATRSKKADEPRTGLLVGPTSLGLRQTF